MRVPSFVSLAVIGLTFLAGSASAVPKVYHVAGLTFDEISRSDPGLIIETEVSGDLAGRSFALDDGDSVDLSLFSIWTDEPSMDDDDLGSHYIINFPENYRRFSANLWFSDPGASITLNGHTAGARSRDDENFGILHFPAFAHADLQTYYWGDRVLGVTMLDYRYGTVWFNTNFVYPWEWTPGKDRAAEIRIRVTQLSSSTPQPVPDASTSTLLLGFALLAVYGIAKRIPKLQPNR